MLEKFALDDRLEQMNAQRRRMKRQEHTRAVEALIEERRARKEFERQQEQRQDMTMRQAEEARRRVIEEERQRLLAEHATKLLGSLPKSVFRGTEEAAQLGPEL